ncbi:MAG: formyltransferase family protein [Bacteroidia bacterium]
MNIYILNTMNSGLDVVNHLLKHISISGVIGLSERDQTDLISGYVYQKEFCKKNNLKFIEVSSYSLNNNADKKLLSSLQIDYLIVTGWQRLIPASLIEKCKAAVIGAHGSPYGITKGRGRSPQNWALILDEPNFEIAIYKIEEGIDSGPVISSCNFQYSVFDNIESSYYKVTWHISEMLIDFFKKNAKGKINLQFQDDTDATYLPQRLPEDGCIDWNRSTKGIYNFIRALSKPYPGSFTTVDNKKVKIFKAIPFELISEKKFAAGEIANIYNNKDLLVKCKDDFILITDYEVEAGFELTERMIFNSCSYKEQLQNILDRHRNKYPHLPLNRNLLNHFDRQ